MIKPPIKIIIADDNRFFCNALKDSLNQHDELLATHIFTTIDDLISFTTNNNLDLLILDVNFNGRSSLDFIPKIKPIGKDFKIIVLTTMNNNFIKNKAINNGVNLFLGKDGDLSTFKDDILTCFYNDNEVLKDKNKKIIMGNYTFTQRKLDVLQALYIHSDKKEKALSATLNITESALKSHKRDLFEISNTKNTTELIKFGIQNGLILP